MDANVSFDKKWKHLSYKKPIKNENILNKFWRATFCGLAMHTMQITN